MKSIIEMADTVEAKISHGIRFWGAVHEVVEGEITEKNTYHEVCGLRRDLEKELSRRMIARIKDRPTQPVLQRQTRLFF
jgi:hypothetical protein